jgi:hypothetical protein
VGGFDVLWIGQNRSSCGDIFRFLGKVRDIDIMHLQKFFQLLKTSAENNKTEPIGETFTRQNDKFCTEML